MRKHFQTVLSAAALTGALLLPGCCGAKTCKKQEVTTTWPDREWLVKSVVRTVPTVLSTFRPETGELGQKPWVCLDQNDVFMLSVAWATESENNPYYHDPAILNVITKAGDRLVEAQDAKGMWTFRKKDNSTWGQIHMPWTYIRWIRAYAIVKDALPEASRAKWEKGLKLGYSHIVNSCKGKGTHNITALNASGLYLAGVLFDNKDWRDTAQNFMHRVCAKQTADGFWSEHYGPVVIYNTYYLEALGLYYSYSKDPVVLEALKRGAKFHSNLLWQDSTSVSIIDERNAYSGARRSGNVGFTFTPEGRQYLLKLMGMHMRAKTPIGGDYAAAMLWNGGQGPAAPEPAESSRYDSHDKMFSIVRSAPYQWALSSYCCPAYPVRWIMDRQTHVEIAIDGVGVIGSGGNTKMQPYFSTFTFGDPATFQPDYKNTDPDFINKTPLKYLPDSAKINGNTVELTYGKNHCSVTVRPEKNALALEYRLTGTPDAAAMAHFPVITTSTPVTELDNSKVYTGRDLNNILKFRNGLVINLPDDAEIRPLVTGFNPYEKFGRNAGDRLVISLPFTHGKMVQTLRFSREINKTLENAERFMAVQLEYYAKNGTMKVLEDMEATVFLRSIAPGGELHFKLYQPEAKERELILSLNNFNCYGIVQVLVNGREIGKPFSTYAGKLVLCEPRSMGKVILKKGENDITLRVVGKDPASSNYFTSIRDIYLK